MNIYYQIYFASFLLQCIFQFLLFPLHTIYFDILSRLDSTFFYQERDS